MFPAYVEVSGYTVCGNREELTIVYAAAVTTQKHFAEDALHATEAQPRQWPSPCYRPDWWGEMWKDVCVAL